MGFDGYPFGRIPKKSHQTTCRAETLPKSPISFPIVDRKRLREAVPLLDKCWRKIASDRDNIAPQHSSKVCRKVAIGDRAVENIVARFAKFKDCGQIHCCPLGQRVFSRGYLCSSI